MQFRTNLVNSNKIEMQITPMIDVVFLLLIFFMLTLKIVEPEGDFQINMPIAAPEQSEETEIELPDIRIRLVANSDGSLKQILFGERSLGTGKAAFQKLNREILKIIGFPGNPETAESEVEIDADFNLHYENIVSAVSACSGSLKDGQIVRYIEKIKFARQRPSPEP